MPMFIFTVILYQSFRRLLQQHRSRLLWITLVFLGAISFGTVEWATPLSAGTTPPTGKIRVFKVTKPSGDTTEFSFNLSGPKLKRTFSLADGERKNVANLTTGGGYSISEAVPAGWMLQSATCSDGSPIHNINVGANEVVDCTFVNVKLGTIVVKVTTLPDEDLATSFPLSAGGGLSPTTFTLKNGQHYTFADLVPGNHYNLVETVPAGWMLGSASCSDGSPFTKVDVSAGETVTCIFVNKQLGKLIIRKTTLPDPDRTASTFSFVTENTLSPNSFTLKNDEERSYSNVEPRAGYQIRELATPNWQLSSSSCDNDSPLNNIRIDPGQTVICSFTNRGTLIDLSLTKDDGGVTAEPRDTIVYTLRYRNKGNQTANGVTITEQVPANTTFVASPEIAALWDCANDAPAGSICHHTVGALAGGTQGQVEFHVKLLNSLPATVTTIDNTATLGYRDNPNAAHGNSSTPVKTKAVLTLNKGDDGAKAKPGDTIRYTLDYKNEGNQTISGVRITETVPLNTTFVDLGEGWNCVDGAPAGTRCVREIGSIGGGKDGSFPFTVKVATTLPPAVTAIENRAIIGSPLYPNADTGTEQTEVQAAPDLAVTIDNN
ncbi:MAG: DUF11 domain-containing protein, partial [Caldilineaceae bacterium]|nr:DUF11 domain-containing protein [Caldilineaceae bacterium]